jgi:hypothetical protein
MLSSEDKTLEVTNLHLYNVKPKYIIEGEEKAESIKRSKGKFMEFEKNDGNKGKYTTKDIKDTVKDNVECLFNRCYYKTSTVDGFHMHIHK